MDNFMKKFKESCRRAKRESKAWMSKYTDRD